MYRGENRRHAVLRRRHLEQSIEELKRLVQIFCSQGRNPQLNFYSVMSFLVGGRGRRPSRPLYATVYYAPLL